MGVTSDPKWLKGGMDLGLKRGDGKENLRLFITDSSSGHKKIKRFEKNICNTHASTCEKWASWSNLEAGRDKEL